MFKKADLEISASKNKLPTNIKHIDAKAPYSGRVRRGKTLRDKAAIKAEKGVFRSAGGDKVVILGNKR